MSKTSKNATVSSDVTAAMEHTSGNQNIDGQELIDHDYTKIYPENNNILKYITNLDTSDLILDENDKDRESLYHAKDKTSTEENASSKQNNLENTANPNDLKQDMNENDAKTETINEYVCKFCLKEFDNKIDLIMHARKNNKPEMFQCNTRPATVMNESNMENLKDDTDGGFSRTDEKQLKSKDDSIYRYCFVPGCASTSIKFPDKIFIAVPLKPERLEKWFMAVRRQINLSFFAPNSRFHCCEDHFDLQNDAVNWLKYKTGLSPLIMKDDVVPYIYKKTRGNKSARKRKSLNDGLQDRTQQTLKVSKENEVRFVASQLNSIPTRPIISISELVHMTDDQLEIHIKSEEEPNDKDWCISNKDFNESKQAQLNNCAGKEMKQAVESRQCLTNENDSINKCILKEDQFKSGESVTKNGNLETFDVYNRSLSKESNPTLHEKENNLDVPEKVFKCRDCPSTFLKHEDMAQHVRVWHGTNYEFRALISQYQSSFKQVKELANDDTKNISNVIIDTDVFKKSGNFQKDNSYKLDFIEQIPRTIKGCTKKRQTCTICGKDFVYNHFKSHMKEVHSTEEFTCTICGGIFKCERYLKKHMIIHEKRLQRQDRNTKCLCPECPKSFKNNDCLSHHVKNCHGSKVECELCHSKLKSISYLKTHMRRVHYDDGKIHNCKVCYKPFKSPRQVKIHMINLHPEILHPCPNCVRLFCNAVQLRIHLKKCKPKEPDNITVDIEKDGSVEDDEDVDEVIKVDDNVDLTVD